ncbi:hypothetical protein PPERSA_12549 [Pseudocohnilembus persalinus]|uniref:Uncharacterized protein n=1 Tax=Pseudocohnilembus persalinus TaxID=266149 RepID=A0A0V0Q860_PSEPJ|nr:hypothetical protein PPERSA_12549 [Pseudocohnilembus persalinus]|eukprot:KRW98440.1 hypothetical protein PPERSA_12549 [Pseudocohnilembus persalinus]
MDNNSQIEESKSFEQLPQTTELNWENKKILEEEKKCEQEQSCHVVNSSDYDWEQLENLGDESFIHLDKNEKFSEKSFSIGNLNQNNENSSLKQQNKIVIDSCGQSFFNLSQNLRNLSQNQNSWNEICMEQEHINEFSKLLDELNQSQNGDEKQNILNGSINLSESREKLSKKGNLSNDSSFQNIRLEQNQKQSRKESSFFIVQKIHSQDFKWEELAKQQLEELSFTKQEKYVEVKIDVRKLFANNKRLERSLTEKQKEIRNKIRELCLQNIQVQQQYIPKRIAIAEHQQKEKNLDYNAIKHLDKKFHGSVITHKAHQILGDKHCKKYTKKNKIKNQDRTFVKIK